MSWNDNHPKPNNQHQNRQLVALSVITGIIVLVGLGVVYMFMQGASTKKESTAASEPAPQDTTGRVCLYTKDLNVISWKSTRMRGVSNSGSVFFTEADTGITFDILPAEGFLISTDAHECPNLKGKVSP